MECESFRWFVITSVHLLFNQATHSCLGSFNIFYASFYISQCLAISVLYHPSSTEIHLSSTSFVRLYAQERNFCWCILYWFTQHIALFINSLHYCILTSGNAVFMEWEILKKKKKKIWLLIIYHRGLEKFHQTNGSIWWKKGVSHAFKPLREEKNQ